MFFRGLGLLKTLIGWAVILVVIAVIVVIYYLFSGGIIHNPFLVKSIV
jgi:hypothetical protein